jgi:hypothetical protein
MKSLWKARDRENIERRLNVLAADAERQWGTLTPQAAVAHLADSMRMALGQIQDAPLRTALRYPPLKWLALYVLPMPKGVRGPDAYFTTPPTTLDEDRGELIRLIEECRRRPADASWGENPFFGPLTKAQWGALAYKHIDHHLRQFGC